KTGRVCGDLLATLTILKGLPLSYNRDLQETQEPLFDAADTLEAALDAMTEVVGGLALRPGFDRAPIESAALATDIAEELVRRGVPFRTAHETVARWTRGAARKRRDLRAIAAAESPKLGTFLKKLTPESAVARRDLPGGTAPRRVKAAIAKTRRALETPSPTGRGRG
ncbi:MAG: argininosuccinate lyase, partial [Thermoanaerobaculia bacterium]